MSVARAPSSLGALLSEARRRRGMSQRKLAEMSGVSNTTIASLERGKGSRGSAAVKPSPETLRLLTRGLATDLVDGRVDEQSGLEIYTVLMRAAGYSWELQVTRGGGTA